MVDVVAMPMAFDAMPMPMPSYLDLNHPLDNQLEDDMETDMDMETEVEADVYELACRLSAACKANCNVLVDNAVVDALETQGKAILHARGRAKSPCPSLVMNPPQVAASRYDVLPANGYYAREEDAEAANYGRKVSFEDEDEGGMRASPTQTHGYSPRLESFKLNDDLAASSASTYSTLSMAHYDDASESDSDDADESVVDLSFGYGLGDRKYSVFSNTSEGSASRVLPYDVDPMDEELVYSLQDQVDMLLLENCQIVAENARLAEMSEMTAAEVELLASRKQSAEELLRTQSQRLMSVEMALEESRGQHGSAADRIRAEMRAEFEAELAARTQEMARMQSEVASKNSEIAQLSRNVDEISAVMDNGSSTTIDESEEGDADMGALISSLRQNNVVKETEILEMQETLMQKDHEICSLYMHLSTKKKLIDEITRSFVQNMEEVNAAKTPSADVRFDLDTCLFKSVVDKEKRLDELTAALRAMEQEVEELESRIASKEREKHTLSCNQQLLGRTLQAMKSQLSQVQVEKVHLDTALNESQARIAVLMESLEQKDKQIRELHRLSLPQGATIPSF